MSVWSQEDYIKAWNFASVIHNQQKIPTSNIPYINHLGLVSMEATAAIAQSETLGDGVIQQPNILVLCALLHDAIEDTPTEYQEIEVQFGSEVAKGVLALTKDKNLPSKQAQMEDSICRIKQQPKEVWMVKLCDRITNLQPPPKHWDKDKIAKYRDEAVYILEQLGEANSFLAKRLQDKILGYTKYL